MAEERVERRLAAILAADVTGYSRLMERDETGTLARLKTLRRELIDPEITEHHGRIVKTTGDGILVEFHSVVDAMGCAISVQNAMHDRNAAVPPDSRIEFRVGVNVGDVIVDGDDLYGDGVNIAARLEAMAEPGGICISRTVVTQTRGKLDFPAADLGAQTLKNMAQPVHVFRVLVKPPPIPDAMSESPPLPDKPSIAVLPFQNMSGDPEQEYFADGMVEEIITALSHIRGLFVIARNSSFTYKGQAVDVKRVGRELGVRYVLEGSVRKGGHRVRITAQLIEAETGAHLWADQFDGSLEDVFELQDQVASSVAGVIEPTLQAAETARSAARPTNDLTAYDLYLRAYDMVVASAREAPEALRLLERAIARDPRYGPAVGWAAHCCYRMVLDGRSEDPEAHTRKGVEYARRALEVANNDPGILVNAAQTLAYFGEEIGAMLALIDRALAYNPSFARGWLVSSNVSNWAGKPERAIEHAANALRLSPRGGLGLALLNLGQGLFFARRFEEAVPKLVLALQEDPSLVPVYRHLASCYANMGRLDKARDVVRRLRAITPLAVVPDASRYRDPELRQMWLSGLLAAANAADER